MSSRLSDKKSRVVVVDPSASGRQVLTDAVRKLGFEAVEGRPSHQEVLQYLEVETADWLILPLMADQPVNALQVLRIVTEHPELKGIRISLLVDDDEKYVLPHAFEHGLLSYHSRSFSKDSIGEDLNKLLTTLQEYQYNEPRTAAHFLRGYLKEKKQWDALVELEKGLLDLYPGDVKTLMNIVEPFYCTGRRDDARKTLAQVKLLDPNLEDQAKELGKQFFGPDYDANASGDGEAGFNVLGIDFAVVVDSDDTVAKGVEDILKKLGVKNVERFNDGISAAEFLEKSQDPKLVIMEWRIPKLSGPFLLQRIRQSGHLATPIVVLSSLLKTDDMPLVKEMGVATVLSKPVNKDLFIPGLIWMMQQERLPTEAQSLERKIRSLIAQNNMQEAGEVKARYMAEAGISIGRKRQIEAEFAFATANYLGARDAGVESLKMSGDSIHTLNLLGKSFMRLSNFDAALKCFKKAQEMSPHNIERLCNIAEVQTELGDDKASKEALDQAKALDSGSETITEAEVKVAVVKGDTNAAKKIMSELESLGNIVAYMNNKAVAHAKCNETAEAIDLYKKTLDSIPDDRVETKVIVQYNTALAQARAGDMQGALAQVEQVLEVKGSKVEKKAQSLRTRLKASIDAGKDFKLASDSAQASAAPASGDTPKEADEKSAAALASEDDLRRLMAKVEAKRGDLCCFLIFNTAGNGDARTDSLLANPPRFGRRNAIARSESFGVEGVKKAG